MQELRRNKHNKVLSTIQLVVLMKIVCSFFFVCSNYHSDMKSLNVNRVTDDNLDLLLPFNPFFFFVGFFDVTSILKNVEKSVNNFLITDAG